MNVLVIDSQRILSDFQRTAAENCLCYALAEFEYRVRGATMHFSKGVNGEHVRCSINVVLEGYGVVSVNRSSRSPTKCMVQAVDVVESKVASRLDWRAKFHPATVQSLMSTLMWPLAQANRLVADGIAMAVGKTTDNHDRLRRANAANGKKFEKPGRSKQPRPKTHVGGRTAESFFSG